jgi:hypothetical protein
MKIPGRILCRREGPSGNSSFSRKFRAGREDCIASWQGMERRHMQFRKVARFLRETRGLVTIEWVGIVMVALLAAVSLTSFVMQRSAGVGEAIDKRLEAAEPTYAPDLDFNP